MGREYGMLEGRQVSKEVVRQAGRLTSMLAYNEAGRLSVGRQVDWLAD